MLLQKERPSRRKGVPIVHHEDATKTIQSRGDNPAHLGEPSSCFEHDANMKERGKGVHLPPTELTLLRHKEGDIVERATNDASHELKKRQGTLTRG